jgi:hypothetical protein
VSDALDRSSFSHKGPRDEEDGDTNQGPADLEDDEEWERQKEPDEQESED